MNKNTTMLLLLGGAAAAAYFLLKGRGGPRLTGGTVQSVDQDGRPMQTFYGVKNARGQVLNDIKAISLNRDNDPGIYVTNPWQIALQ